MTEAFDIDREEWDAAWREMEVRDLPEAAGADFNEWFSLDAGPAISATLSGVPAEYQDRMYFPTELCPVCRRSTRNLKNVRMANLSTDFKTIHGLACGTWIHETCFEQQPISDKPPPIPW